LKWLKKLIKFIVAGLILLFVVILILQKFGNITHRISFSGLGTLPDKFKLYHLRPTSDGKLLVGGAIPSGDNSRDPSIFFQNGDELTQIFSPQIVSWSPPENGYGWIAAIGNKDDIIVAALKSYKSSGGVEGRDYEIYVSTDLGKSWSNRGKLPAVLHSAKNELSLIEIIVHDQNTFWLVGLNILGKTNDGAKSWKSFPIPFNKTTLSSNLIIENGDQLLYSGEGLAQSSDSAKSWKVISENKIEASDGTYYLSSNKDQSETRLEKLINGKLELISTIEESLLVESISHLGMKVFFTASVIGTGSVVGGAELRIYISIDGGKTFKNKMIHGIGLNGDNITTSSGEIWRVRQNRTIYRATIPSK
jgi:hypothetical protein